VQSLRLSAPSGIEFKAVSPPKEGIPTVVLDAQSESGAGSLAWAISSPNLRRLYAVAAIGIVGTVLLVAWMWRPRGSVAAANPRAEAVDTGATPAPAEPPRIAPGPPSTSPAGAAALPEPVGTKSLASTAPSPGAGSGKAVDPAHAPEATRPRSAVEPRKTPARRAPPAAKGATSDTKATGSAPSVPAPRREPVVDDGF
jgi:hypothetical protein